MFRKVGENTREIGQKHKNDPSHMILHMGPFRHLPWPFFRICLPKTAHGLHPCRTTSALSLEQREIIEPCPAETWKCSKKESSVTWSRIYESDRTSSQKGHWSWTEQVTCSTLPGTPSALEAHSVALLKTRAC